MTCKIQTPPMSSTPDTYRTSLPQESSLISGGTEVRRPTPPVNLLSVAKPKFVMSPHKLYLTNCRCLNPTKPPPNASSQIDLMIDGLEKLMDRLAGVRLHNAIKDAGIRILIELRGRGMELFHLIGWVDTSPQGGKSRRVIAFAVPDQNQAEETGHRVVAQLVISIENKGQFKGTIGDVSVRFEDDWDDWTMVQTSEFVSDPKYSKAQRRMMVEGDVKSGKVAEKIWDAVTVMQGEDIGCLRAKVVSRLNTVLQKLDLAGEILAAFEAEQLLRKTGERRTQPTIAIRLYTRLAEASPMNLGEHAKHAKTVSTGEGQASNKKDDGDEYDDERSVAVVLIDLSTNGSMLKVKHVSVVYDGEWPITHRYRTDSDVPTLKGLEELVSTK